MRYLILTQTSQFQSSSFQFTFVTYNIVSLAKVTEVNKLIELDDTALVWRIVDFISRTYFYERFTELTARSHDQRLATVIQSHQLLD